MTNKLNEVLNEKFGYSTFRPGQEEAIESVLAGKDTLVMLPTGMGKSLCYQLPAYVQEGTTLIVSPLLSLMQDQVENLRLQGERGVVALNSLTSYSERRRIFQQIEHYRFIYTSPEMLQNNHVLQALKRVNIRLFVVDEAHCISHWGTDFRPDYLVLVDVRKQFKNPVTIALTATATAHVRQEIIQFLGLTNEATNQIVLSVDRPEIKYIVEYCQGNKLGKILYYIQNIQGPGIIYFMSKKLAEQTAEILHEQYKINVGTYHSDIESDDKIKIQQQFLQDELQIICATSAFGMGFDKKDIRFIIHYHLPDSPEMYLQEVGRAGRDGKESLAVLLYQPGDEQIQKRFLEEALPTKEILEEASKRNTFNEEPLFKLAHYFIQAHTSMNKALETIAARKGIKNQQLNYMIQYVFHKECKRKYLLNYFNEEKKEDLTFCCSNCGLNMEKTFAQLNKVSPKIYKKEKTIKSWKTIFEVMYNKQ